MARTLRVFVGDYNSTTMVNYLQKKGYRAGYARDGEHVVVTLPTGVSQRKMMGYILRNWDHIWKIEPPKRGGRCR